MPCQIGSRGKADVGSKSLCAQARLQLLGPSMQCVGFRGLQSVQSPQVHGAQARGGGFQVRRKSVGALEQYVGGGCFLCEGAVADADAGASRQRLGGGLSAFHASVSGRRGHFQDDRGAARRVYQCHRLFPEFRRQPQCGLERELRQVNDGEHGAGARIGGRAFRRFAAHRLPALGVAQSRSGGSEYRGCARDHGGRAGSGKRCGRRPRPPRAGV